MTLSALIVDDEPLARQRIRRFLKEHKDIASVRECMDGVSAVKAIRSDRPDLVFLDMHMPEMNGLDLLVELRGREVDLPAILITTHPSSEVRRRAALAGVTLIEKPLLNDTLFLEIRAALDGDAVRKAR